MNTTLFIISALAMGLGLLIGCICPILSTMDHVVALEALFVGVAMAGAGCIGLCLVELTD